MGLNTLRAFWPELQRLLIVLAILLAARELKPMIFDGNTAWGPKPDVGEMSIPMMEAELDGGTNAVRRVDIVVRLARIYALYGTARQKIDMRETLIEMSDNGAPKASAALCREVHREALGLDFQTHCARAASGGDGEALYERCVYYYNIDEDELGFAACQKANDLDVKRSYLPLGLAFARGLGTPPDNAKAYAQLERTILEGAWQDRGTAVRAMQSLPRSEGDYLHRYKRRKSWDAIEMTATQTRRATPPKVHHHVKGKGACIITCEITPTGLAFNARIYCSHPLMEERMQEALHDWTFRDYYNRRDPEAGIYYYDHVLRVEYKAPD